MVPEIPATATLPPYVDRTSLQAIDWVYRGLITHRGTWAFLGSGKATDAQITAVNYDTNQIHLTLYENGLRWYDISPSFGLFLQAFTFNQTGIDCRTYQLGLETAVAAMAAAYPAHTCTDHRKTYDSGCWTRYDYCGVCDKKIA